MQYEWEKTRNFSSSAFGTAAANLFGSTSSAAPGVDMETEDDGERARKS